MRDMNNLEFINWLQGHTGQSPLGKIITDEFGMWSIQPEEESQASKMKRFCNSLRELDRVRYYWFEEDFIAQTGININNE